MKIEIWSDIMCPFCYIGKRRLERALDQFPQKEEVEIIWRSFQLNPEMKDEPGKDIYTYLAEVKGQSREWSVQMHQHVVDMAKGEGLDYRFDLAAVANSRKAHQLIQYAKEMGKGDEIEERIFKAYFTEGAVISDPAALVQLGTEIGLDPDAVRAALEDDQYAYLVKQDIQEAAQLGVTGVPFFVFDRKYAISGAQQVEVFQQVLQKTQENG